MRDANRLPIVAFELHNTDQGFAERRKSTQIRATHDFGTSTLQRESFPSFELSVPPFDVFEALIQESFPHSVLSAVMLCPLLLRYSVSMSAVMLRERL